MHYFREARSRSERMAAGGCAAIGACFLLLAVGCGGEHYPQALVSGVITLNGKPLADAKVGFEPVRKEGRINAGPGAYGKTDAEGRFELTVLGGDPGAVVGKHRVWIRTSQTKEGPNGSTIVVSPEKLPPKYNAETELTIEVPEGGTSEANFDLTLP